MVQYWKHQLLELRVVPEEIRAGLGLWGAQDRGTGVVPPHSRH